MSPRTLGPRSVLAVESLEQRATPAVALTGGNLFIYGTSFNDQATVNFAQSGGQTFYQVRDNGVTHNFNLGQVTGFIWFSGGDGNDTFENNTGLNSIALGGNGQDTLQGGSGNDYLDGGFGTDYLSGGMGNDYLNAGAGLDYAWNLLDGGDGSDTLHGSEGNDVLLGGAGIDQLHGHGGNDNLDGGNDNVPDFLFGGAGNDVLVLEVNFYQGVFTLVDLPGDTEGDDTVVINL